MIELE